MSGSAKLSLSLLAAIALPGMGLRAAPVAADHLSIELVSERNALVPGRSAWLGLRIRHEPQWHTYWINPGDSGLPTRVTWTLPAGFSAGDIAWPAPKRFVVDGLANFGYDGEVLLPVALGVPVDARVGTTVRVAATVKWLVCHEECVPGKTTLTLDLPIAAVADSPDASFEAARAAQPENGLWNAEARILGDRVEVRVRGADPSDGGGLDAFAEQPKIVVNAAPQVSVHDGVRVLVFTRSEYFTRAPKALDLVLVRAGARAIRVHAPFVAPASALLSK